MQVTGTKEAFMSLISQKGFAARSGINKSTVSQWSKGERVPSLDKMEEVLLLAGASVVKEKVWEVVVDPYLEKMINFENELRTKKIGDSITVKYLNGLSSFIVRNKINHYAGELGADADNKETGDYTETFTFIEKGPDSKQP